MPVQNSFLEPQVVSPARGPHELSEALLLRTGILGWGTAGGGEVTAPGPVLRTRVVTLGKVVRGNEAMGWPKQLALSSTRWMRILGQYLRSVAPHPQLSIVYQAQDRGLSSGSRVGKPRAELFNHPTHLATMDISCPKTAAVPKSPCSSLSRSKTSFRSCTFLLKGIPLLLICKASLMVRVKRTSCL